MCPSSGPSRKCFSSDFPKDVLSGQALGEADLIHTELAKNSALILIGHIERALPALETCVVVIISRKKYVVPVRC